MTRKEIILKPMVNVNDVMFYCDCGKNKAYRIMTACRVKYSGDFGYDKRFITTESLMAFFGTTRERELKLLSYENLQEDKVQ